MLNKILIGFIALSSYVAFADSNTLLTDKIFSPTSFWYQDISKAPIDANSDNWKAEFNRQVKTYYGNVSVALNAYTAPVYEVGTDVKTMKVKWSNCANQSSVDPSFLTQISAIPIPLYAKASDGLDSEIAIYQPSTNSYWELWKANKTPTTGEWLACWGGKMDNTRLSDGIFPAYYGTTATSIPFIGGQVTAEELTRGEIRHAIGISLVDLDNWNVVSWPAHRSDGGNPQKLPNRIAEGQRFRLDPSIDVDKLPMSKAGKTIAKAAQKYGFVVWDKAGAVVIRAKNPLSYTALGLPNPYPAAFENKATWAVLSGFPWDKLQFLPRSYGKP